jgi:hypothetical protein
LASLPAFFRPLPSGFRSGQSGSLLLFSFTLTPFGLVAAGRALPDIELLAHIVAFGFAALIFRLLGARSFVVPRFFALIAAQSPELVPK